MYWLNQAMHKNKFYANKPVMFLFSICHRGRGVKCQVLAAKKTTQGGESQEGKNNFDSCSFWTASSEMSGKEK